MRVLVIGHDHVADAALVGDALVGLGAELDLVTVVPEHRHATPDVDVTFPDPAGADLVVTLGAPWPRERIAGWVADEVRLLADAHARGVPVLGICGGAQFLAEALGGGAEPMPAPRVGWFPVSSSCPAIAAGPWFQWHADRIVVPPGAEVLAHSADGVEAFRVGTSVGVQFHPEMTPALLDAWLGAAGVDDPALRAATAAQQGTAARARALVEGLLRSSRAP